MSSRRYICITSIVLCLFAVAAMRAQADFTMDLSVPKKNYLVDEPLFVVVRARNTGGPDIKLFRLFGVGDIYFMITPPGEKPHRWNPPLSFDPSPEGVAQLTTVLASGDSFTSLADITLDPERGRLTLFGPGEYLIKAVVLGDPGIQQPESNTVTISVQKPVGTDRKAHGILLEAPNEYGSKMWAPYDEFVDYYERVIEECPRSAYEAYAKFQLARCYDWDSGQHSRSTLEKTVRLYDDVAKTAAHTPLAAWATRLAAVAYSNTGDVATAQAMFDKAFAMRESTDGDRIEMLLSLHRLQTGVGKKEYYAGNVAARTDLQLPLDLYADGLGYLVRLDPKTNEALVFRRNKVCTFKAGDSSITLNGKRFAGFVTAEKDGRVYVSLSVIAALAAERYGGGMASTLSDLLPPDYPKTLPKAAGGK